MRRRTHLRALLAAVLAVAGCVAATGALGATRTLAARGPASGLPHVTVSPLAGTPDAAPVTQISFLGAPASAITRISVIGSSSGPHAGRLEAYASGTGASFLPARPFKSGETVSVHAIESIGGRRAVVGTHFTVGTLAPLSPDPVPSFPAIAGTVLDLRSRPDLQPPSVEVTVGAAHPALGDIFLAPYYGDSQSGPMIVSPTGQLVWFAPEPPGHLATDFTVQRYLGRKVLTYWQGQTAEGHGLGEGIIRAADYQPIATIHAGNGLVEDMHDLVLGPGGVAYITSYDPVRANLTALGGSSDGIIEDCVVQEIDVRTGLVMWEWHALGHVPVSESHMPAPAAPDTVYDWFHLNRIQLLANGNLLINSRYTWAAYAIDHATGRVLWQLGGRHSTFTLGPGVSFAYQHDTTVEPDGTVQLFDNGTAVGATAQSPYSSGLVIALDFRTHTATLVRRYVDPQQAVQAQSQGDMQALPGGDELLGYGQVGLVCEVSPTGKLTFAMSLPENVESYRAFRFPWSATPGGTRPAAVASRAAGSTQTSVAVSWDGATTVARWQLLAGATPSAVRPTGAPVADEAFETQWDAETSAPYVAVAAIAADGRVLSRSPATLVSVAS